MQCKVLGWLSLGSTALALLTLAAETVVKFKKVCLCMRCHEPACCGPGPRTRRCPLPLRTSLQPCPAPLAQDPKEVLLTDRSRYFISGLSIACVMLTMLLFVLGHFARRLWEGHRNRRRWTQRRRRASLLSFAQLATQVRQAPGQLRCRLGPSIPAQLCPGLPCCRGEAPGPSPPPPNNAPADNKRGNLACRVGPGGGPHVRVEQHSSSHAG